MRTLGSLLWIGLAVALTLPWLVLRLQGAHPEPLLMALLAGLTIVGAAFLLSWASEVAQLEVSQALAVAVLSLIAILPEYSVDIYFAWRAGQDPAYAHYAVANMTGANRLLIGLGWSAIVVLFWLKTRQPAIYLHRDEGIELSVMALATLYAFWLPLKAHISLLDAVVLIALFAVYVRATAQQPPEEPELVGPARLIGALPRTPRRLVTLGLFVYAAAAILASAEPFAEGLVASGKHLGIDEFLLVQWIAPLASEMPEFVVITLFALRGHPTLALRALLSSKVNQWTLLVGMLPLAYTVGGGGLHPLPMDHRQAEEVFLTAAQSLYGVVLLAGRSFSLPAALSLFGLFGLQFLWPDLRLPVAWLYLGLALGLLVIDAKRRSGLLSLPAFLLKPPVNVR